jgi:6-phosphogluconolactonase
MAASGASRVFEQAEIRFRAFTSRGEASQALADDLACVLAAAVERYGAAALVVSGGTSPSAMFRILRDEPLPWSRVTVVPSDEREVEPEHPDRNEAMIRRELLSGNAADARLVSLIPPGDIPDAFDATVLGMGSDGHTASLFPGSPDLERTLRSTAKLERLDVPQMGVHRVSLTPAVLLRSGRIILLFFGEDKRRVFEDALKNGKTCVFPVRVVLHQARTPVDVYWAP